MGPSASLLVACLVGCLVASVAQSPTAVAYLNTFNPSDVDSLVNENTGYSHFLFAFWTERFGPVDAARVWMDGNLANDPRIQAARQRGVKFMISCGGATEEPQRSVSGAAYGGGVAKFAVDYGFDGVDFDIEGFAPGNSGTGTKWLVDATTEAKRVCPHCIITHAPQAPYYSTAFTANYFEVERQVGSMIDFYNIQFYNQGSTNYESYQTLFEVAEGWSRGTAVREIVQGGIPLSKIVVGKPITRAGVFNSGFVEMNQLALFFQQAKNNGILPRGFMGWQWSLDVVELRGAWARTLGEAWTGFSGSFPEPQPIPQPVPQPQPTVQPQPVPQPQPTLQPQPVPQPQPTLQPQPVPQPQPTLQSQPVPQPQPTLQPQPVPQPNVGATGNRQCANVHLVQPGDTIFGIANQEGKLWQDIFVENQFDLPNPWQLEVGSNLRIPPCTTGPPVIEQVLPYPQPVLPAP